MAERGAMLAPMKTWVLFDWGDTLMRVFPNCAGKMKDWPRVEEVPGARKALHALHGRVGIALATHAADSEEADIREALERVALSAFVKPIFCLRAVGAKKNTPAFFFAHVQERLHASPNHLVMVGDDFAEDVEAARAAGLWAVWFNPRTPENAAGDRYTTIHRLEALPAVLMGWGLLSRE